MLKNIFCIIICFAILTLSRESIAYQQAVTDSSNAVHSVSISTEISKSEVPLNYKVELLITLKWEGRPDRIEIKNFDDPILTNFDILKSSSVSRSELKDGKIFTIKEFYFELQPVEIGMGYVEDMSLGYVDQITKVQDFLFTKRMSVKVGRPEYPTNYSLIWQSLLGIILVGGLVYGVKVLQKKKKEKQIKSDVVELSVEEKYFENLKSIRDQNSKSYKQRMDEIITVFRHYLTHKFEIDDELKGNLSDIIINVSRQGIDNNTCRDIKNIFEQAEQLRFSGTEVSFDKFELVYGNIEGIINKCKDIKDV